VSSFRTYIAMLSAGYGGREFGLYAKEGIMAGRWDCCRYEPNLEAEELLDDEMMESVLRSAGFDLHGFREMIRRLPAGLTMLAP
jgi:hypothetical protein